MSTDSQQIVDEAWSFANVLRDDGLSYMAYTEQITFLLKQGFEGKLVPQDAHDEPASVLLKRGKAIESVEGGLDWKDETGENKGRKTERSTSRRSKANNGRVRPRRRP